MRETGLGAFRESADEDPHGTRAIAMQLTAAGRELLSRPPGALWPHFVAWALLVAPFIGFTSIEASVAMGVVAALALAWAIGERFTPRFRIDHEGLTITRAWGQRRRHRWCDVQRFTLGRDTARATLGDDMQTFEARAVRGCKEAWVPLDRAVRNADLVIERGAHRTVLTVLAFAAVMAVAVGAGWITLAWGFAASTLALIVVNLAIRAPDAVLSADGVDTGFGLLPWSRIRDGAQRSHVLGGGLIVHLEDGTGRFFLVPSRARAGALTAELMRRKAAASTASV